MKLNHNEFLSYPNTLRPDPVCQRQAGVRHGRAWASARRSISGPRSRSGRFRKSSQMFQQAHELGLFTVLWCYLRNPAFKTKDVDYHLAADLTGQANHLGVTIGADIIKQKMPENNGGYNAAQVRQDAQGRLLAADERQSDRPDALPGGQLLHGPRAAHQLRRRIGRRQRPEGGRQDRRHQQARRRCRADLRPQGVPAADEGGRGAAHAPSRTSTWPRKSRSPDGREPRLHSSGLRIRSASERTRVSASCVLWNASSSHGISSGAKNRASSPSSSHARHAADHRRRVDDDHRRPARIRVDVDQARRA